MPPALPPPTAGPSARKAPSRASTNICHEAGCSKPRLVKRFVSGHRFSDAVSFLPPVETGLAPSPEKRQAASLREIGPPYRGWASTSGLFRRLLVHFNRHQLSFVLPHRTIIHRHDAVLPIAGKLVLSDHQQRFVIRSTQLVSRHAAQDR